MYIYAYISNLRMKTHTQLCTQKHTHVHRHTHIHNTHILTHITKSQHPVLNDANCEWQVVTYRASLALIPMSRRIRMKKTGKYHCQPLYLKMLIHMKMTNWWVLTGDGRGSSSATQLGNSSQSTGLSSLQRRFVGYWLTKHSKGARRV